MPAGGVPDRAGVDSVWKMSGGPVDATVRTRLVAVTMSNVPLLQAAAVHASVEPDTVIRCPAAKPSARQSPAERVIVAAPVAKLMVGVPRTAADAGRGAWTPAAPTSVQALWGPPDAPGVDWKM